VYTFNAAGSITALTPNNGPQAGANQMTIAGANLGALAAGGAVLTVARQWQ
jgi:hypothetical protein